MRRMHTFHVPVMGIGYTIDTPIKVAQFGIDSVISLVDDILMEKLRKFYCEKFEMPYKEITDKVDDFRAKRITSFLDMVHSIADKKLEELRNVKNEKSNAIKEYFSMLPDGSGLKEEFKKLTSKHFNLNELRHWLKSNLSLGSIDVNIMTKVDKDNYANGEKLPIEYNDAHAAIRGYANSNLTSSVVLSAGMHPRLYTYMEQFEDFYPNKNGEIKKKIVLKVSDYKSALVQGKFLAKKGLWVSEFRIESGLNCGGHAFATEGYLMGPILAEFRDKRDELIRSMHEVFVNALESKNKVIPENVVPISVTAQGGVGTAEEHQFLIDHYKVDSVGWGTPFLLVPEVTSIDDATVEKLEVATEDDLYLSDISPLGIPFNSLKGNTKDIEKQEFIDKGKPGSTCPKRYAALNTEFGKGLCTASRQYQRLKLEQIKNQNLPAAEYQKEYDKIVEKSCTCVGLGTATLVKNGLDMTVEGEGISVCPGPNMAYFSKRMKLKELIDHIYGRINVIKRNDRPNMFVKELGIYLEFLKKKFEESKDNTNPKQQKSLENFVNNMKDGISYYQNMFADLKENFQETKKGILEELENGMNFLQNLTSNKA